MESVQALRMPCQMPRANALVQEALPGVVEPGRDLLLCGTGQKGLAPPSEKGEVVRRACIRDHEITAAGGVTVTTTSLQLAGHARSCDSWRCAHYRGQICNVGEHLLFLSRRVWMMRMSIHPDLPHLGHHM